MDKYNLEYKGVTCTAVDWESNPYKFVFQYKGFSYVFEQKRYISQSADTDHIRCAIEQFLEGYGVDFPPVKVGQTVYQTDGVRIYESTVRNVIYETEKIAFDESAIGNSIFLTREESERKLEAYV